MVHRFFRPKGQDSRTEGIWLTIYADLMTNLFMVFLALYGLTIMGDESVSKALSYMKKTAIIEEKKLNPENFDEAAQIIRHVLPISPDLTISETPGVLRIQFGENLLFSTGHADLKESSKITLEKIAAVLKKIPFTFVVEGHTDDRPVGRLSRYKNNKELSLARAMSVLNLITENKWLDPSRLAIATYEANHPRASNQTASGRRLNRRVELAIFKDFPTSSKEGK